LYHIANRRGYAVAEVAFIVIVYCRPGHEGNGRVFRELAQCHRQLASGLHNNELIGALLRLAADCDERAEALGRSLAARTDAVTVPSD